MNDQASGRNISVYGTGEASVAPDLASVIFVVSASGKEPAALREDISRRASAVLARLRELGIAEPDLNAPGLTIQPEYDYRDGQRLIGYRAARALDARVRDLDRLGEVLDAIVAAGANEVSGVHMTAADLAPTEHAALSTAVAAARAKAAVLAEAASTTLGAVVRIEEEPSFAQPVPMFRAAAAEMAADASTEIVGGPLTITCRVRVWFALD